MLCGLFGLVAHGSVGASDGYPTGLFRQHFSGFLLPAKADSEHPKVAAVSASLAAGLLSCRVVWSGPHNVEALRVGDVPGLLHSSWEEHPGVMTATVPARVLLRDGAGGTIPSTLPVEVVFRGGFTLAGTLVARVTGWAAGTDTDFEAVLVTPGSSPPVAAARVSFLLEGPSSRRARYSVEVSGQPGLPFTFQLSDGSGPVHTHTALELSSTGSFELSQQQWVQLATSRLEVVATAGADWSGARSVITTAPREFRSLLTATGPGPGSGGTATAAVAVIRVGRTGWATAEVMAVGFAEPPLGNSAIDTGATSHFFAFSTAVRHQRVAGSASAGREARGMVLGGFTMSTTDITAAAAGQWHAALRTADGLACAGPFTRSPLASELRVSSVAADRAVGLWSGVMHLDSGSSGEDTAAVGMYFALFDANAGAIGVYTEALPGASHAVGALWLVDQETSNRTWLGAAAPGATVVAGSWSLLGLADEVAAPLTGVLRRFARGAFRLELLLEPAEASDAGLDTVPLTAVLNSAPLYKPAAENLIVIRETARPGDLVFGIDPARPFVYYQGPLECKVAPGSASARSFFAEPDTTNVVVSAASYGFEYNLQNEYSVELEVSDLGSDRTDRIVVNVGIADVNNNRPRFPKRSYSAEVKQDAAPGVEVLTLEAFDADAGFPELTYRMVESSQSSIDAAGVLGVKTATVLDVAGTTAYVAVVYTLARIAAPPGASFTLLVEVDDGVNEIDRAVVTVVVTNINEHFPEFRPATMPGECFGASTPGMCVDRLAPAVPEDAPIGTVIYSFTATDADVGANGAIRFSLAPKDQDPSWTNCGSGVGLFSTTQATQSAGTARVTHGELVVARKLDFEERSDFEICITAVDEGTPARKTHIRVLFTVTDVAFGLQLVSTNLVTSVDPTRGLYLPAGESAPRFTFAANDERETATKLEMQLRLGDTTPQDCVLTDWIESGVCLSPTLLGDVDGVPCRIDESQLPGQLKLVRFVAQPRDAKGLGADCARLDFEAARFRPDANPGDLELDMWVGCGEMLCSELVADSRNGKNGTETTDGYPALDPEDQARLIGLMMAVPRNGFVRNHPRWDDWVSSDGHWVPSSSWTATVTQQLDWSAEKYIEVHGEQGIWLPCGGPAAGLRCERQFPFAQGGTHTVWARAVSSDGKVSATTKVNFTIDRDPPMAISVVMPALLTNSTSARFELVHHDSDLIGCPDPVCLDGAAVMAGCLPCNRGTAVRVLCRLDGEGRAVQFSDCPIAPRIGIERSDSLAVLLDGLADGEHLLELQVVDEAGNDGYSGVSPWPVLQHRWTVDTRPPVGFIARWPEARVSTATAAPFQFSCDESICSYTCELDRTPLACGLSDTPGIGAASLQGLKHGKHQFRVIATDAAGNTASGLAVPEYSWVVDLAAPRLRFISVPPGAQFPGGDVSNSRYWPARVVADENVISYRCRLNSVPIDRRVECCDTAFVGVDSRCRDSCRSAEAPGDQCRVSGGPSDTKARLDAARRAYSVCLLDLLPELRPAVSVVEDWADCANPTNLTDLQHGVAYLFEMVATDVHGNRGTDAEALQWFWAVDDIYIGRSAAVAAAMINAADIDNSTCRPVSSVLIVVCGAVWGCVFVLTLFVVISYRCRPDTTAGMPQADLDAVEEHLSYQQALTMMGMSDAGSVLVEPGYKDAYGTRWDEDADEIDTDIGRVQMTGLDQTTQAKYITPLKSGGTDSDNISAPAGNVTRLGGGPVHTKAQVDTNQARAPQDVLLAATKRAQETLAAAQRRAAENAAGLARRTAPPSTAPAALPPPAVGGKATVADDDEDDPTTMGFAAFDLSDESFDED